MALEIPPELVRNLAEDRGVAFIGSGLSVAAGLPDWPSLLRDLARESFDEGLIGDAVLQELRGWSEQHDYLMLADALLHLLGRPAFEEQMKRRFDVAPRPTEAHRLLAQTPFQAYVTTNYDRLLELAWTEMAPGELISWTYRDEAQLRDPFRDQRRFVMKLHGDILRPDSLVLGLGEYRSAIHRNRACQLFLQDVFRRYQVLFVGYSLTDPDVLFILDQLVAIFGEVPGRHFALESDQRMSPLKAEAFRRNYGIRVLLYHPTQGYPEVTDFLRALQKAVQQKRKEVRGKQLLLLVEASDQDIPMADELRARLIEAVGADVSVRTAGKAVPERREQPQPVVPASPPERGLEEYCSEFVGVRVWKELKDWYASLHGTPVLDLLRINVDRECWRDDLEPALREEFVRALAAARPDAADPFAALSRLIEAKRGSFVLRGRRLDCSGKLYRYMRFGEALARGLTAGSDLENVLLGRPGYPVWCTDGTYAREADADRIARALWGSPVGDIVEIAYSSDTPDSSSPLRVACLPDIYCGGPEYANILKPAAREPGWCHTVRLAQGSHLAIIAPAAVHGPIRLDASRVRTISLRVVSAGGGGAEQAKADH